MASWQSRWRRELVNTGGFSEFDICTYSRISGLAGPRPGGNILYFPSHVSCFQCRQVISHCIAVPTHLSRCSETKQSIICGFVSPAKAVFFSQCSFLRDVVETSAISITKAQTRNNFGIRSTSGCLMPSAKRHELLYSSARLRHRSHHRARS